MTKHLANNSRIFKAHDAFCRFIPTRWRQSTLALSLEAEGLLIRISAFNMEAGVPYPACMTTTARMVGVHRNKLDKVLAVLVEAGEIVSDESGVYSPRALAEFKRSQNAKHRQPETHDEPHSNPIDTPEIPQGNPEATPPVEAEKDEQLLRASRLEENRKERVSESAREGETEVASGLFVNCQTIRHDAFAISLSAVKMGSLALGLTDDQIKEFCTAHAMQWAVEIANGKPPSRVVPERITNFLTHSIMSVGNRVVCAEASASKPVGRALPKSWQAENADKARTLMKKLNPVQEVRQ